MVVRSHRLLSSSVAVVVVVVVIFLNLNYRMSLVLRLLSRRRSREKDHHHFLSRAQSVTFQNKETHPKEEEEQEDKTKPLSLFKVSNASPQTLNRREDFFQDFFSSTDLIGKAYLEPTLTWTRAIYTSTHTQKTVRLGRRRRRRRRRRRGRASHIYILRTLVVFLRDASFVLVFLLLCGAQASRPKRPGKKKTHLFVRSLPCGVDTFVYPEERRRRRRKNNQSLLTTNERDDDDEHEHQHQHRHL